MTHWLTDWQTDSGLIRVVCVCLSVSKSQSVCQSVSQFVSQSVSLSVSQFVSQFVSQSVSSQSEWVSQSAVSLSGSHHLCLLLVIFVRPYAMPLPDWLQTSMNGLHWAWVKVKRGPERRADREVLTCLVASVLSVRQLLFGERRLKWFALLRLNVLLYHGGEKRCGLLWQFPMIQRSGNQASFPIATIE